MKLKVVMTGSLGGECQVSYEFVDGDCEFKTDYVETYTVMGEESFSYIEASVQVQVEEPTNSLADSWIKYLKDIVMARMKERNKEIKEFYYEVDAL